MTTYHIGLISDTHGYMAPAVMDIFKDVDAVIHAGDIGSNSILRQLESIAPVTAVKGNCDTNLLAMLLEDLEFVSFGPYEIAVAHKPSRIKPLIEGGFTGILVFGHTHIPEVFKSHGQLFINPGSPTEPRAEDRRGSVAILTISDASEPVVDFYPVDNDLPLT